MNRSVAGAFEACQLLIRLKKPLHRSGDFSSKSAEIVVPEMLQLLLSVASVEANICDGRSAK
jgi:hypothetical protein